MTSYPKVRKVALATCSCPSHARAKVALVNFCQNATLYLRSLEKRLQTHKKGFWRAMEKDPKRVKRAHLISVHSTSDVLS